MIVSNSEKRLSGVEIGKRRFSASGSTQFKSHMPFDGSSIFLDNGAHGKSCLLPEAENLRSPICTLLRHFLAMHRVSDLAIADFGQPGPVRTRARIGPALRRWVCVKLAVAVVVVSDQIGDLCKCPVFLVFCVHVAAVPIAQSNTRGCKCWKQNT